MMASYAGGLPPSSAAGNAPSSLASVGMMLPTRVGNMVYDPATSSWVGNEDGDEMAEFDAAFDDSSSNDSDAEGGEPAVSEAETNRTNGEAVTAAASGQGGKIGGVAGHSSASARAAQDLAAFMDSPDSDDESSGEDSWGAIPIPGANVNNGTTATADADTSPVDIVTPHSAGPSLVPSNSASLAAAFSAARAAPGGETRLPDSSNSGPGQDLSAGGVAQGRQTRPNPAAAPALGTPAPALDKSASNGMGNDDNIRSQLQAFIDSDSDDDDAGFASLGGRPFGSTSLVPPPAAAAPVPSPALGHASAPASVDARLPITTPATAPIPPTVSGAPAPARASGAGAFPLVLPPELPARTGSGVLAGGQSASESRVGRALPSRSPASVRPSRAVVTSPLQSSPGSCRTGGLSSSVSPIARSTAPHSAQPTLVGPYLPPPAEATAPVGGGSDRRRFGGVGGEGGESTDSGGRLGDAPAQVASSLAAQLAAWADSDSDSDMGFVAPGQASAIDAGQSLAATVSRSTRGMSGVNGAVVAAPNARGATTSMHEPLSPVASLSPGKRSGATFQSAPRRHHDFPAGEPRGRVSPSRAEYPLVAKSPSPSMSPSGAPSPDFAASTSSPLPRALLRAQQEAAQHHPSTSPSGRGSKPHGAAGSPTAQASPTTKRANSTGRPRRRSGGVSAASGDAGRQPRRKSPAASFGNSSSRARGGRTKRAAVSALDVNAPYAPLQLTNPVPFGMHNAHRAQPIVRHRRGGAAGSHSRGKVSPSPRRGASDSHVVGEAFKVVSMHEPQGPSARSTRRGGSLGTRTGPRNGSGMGSGKKPSTGTSQRPSSAGRDLRKRAPPVADAYLAHAFPGRQVPVMAGPPAWPSVSATRGASNPDRQQALQEAYGQHSRPQHVPVVMRGSSMGRPRFYGDGTAPELVAMPHPGMSVQADPSPSAVAATASADSRAHPATASTSPRPPSATDLAVAAHLQGSPGRGGIFKPRSKVVAGGFIALNRTGSSPSSRRGPARVTLTLTGTGLLPAAAAAAAASAGTPAAASAGTPAQAHPQQQPHPQLLARTPSHAADYARPSSAPSSSEASGLGLVPSDSPYALSPSDRVMFAQAAAEHEELLQPWHDDVEDVLDGEDGVGAAAAVGGMAPSVESAGRFWAEPAGHVPGKRSSPREPLEGPHAGGSASSPRTRGHGPIKPGARRVRAGVIRRRHSGGETHPAADASAPTPAPASGKSPRGRPSARASASAGSHSGRLSSSGHLRHGGSDRDRSHGRDPRRSSSCAPTQRRRWNVSHSQEDASGMFTNSRELAVARLAADAQRMRDLEHEVHALKAIMGAMVASGAAVPEEQS